MKSWTVIFHFLLFLAFLAPAAWAEGEGIVCGALTCGVLTIIASIAGFIIHLIIIIWVAKDATARGMDSVPLWVILVFFFPLLGLIVYLVVRPNTKVR